MVGLVLVSHSRAVAEGAAALAAEMGGGAVRIVAVGGPADDPDAFGTDFEAISGALGEADAGDGVLVLMDLGSAVSTTEMAHEMAGAPETVVLSDAPFVEGAVAAAARAGSGASLAEVAAEARDAGRMKAELLGLTEADALPETTEMALVPAEPALRFVIDLPSGLHARPAGRLAGEAGRFDAVVQLRNLTTGKGPANARSLTAIATLGVRSGHELGVAADGPDAEAALTAIRALADEHFGDPPPYDTDGAVPPANGAPSPGRPAAAPAGGDVLHGVAAATGVAVGPAVLLAEGPSLAAVDDAAAGSPEEEHAALQQALKEVAESLAADRAAVAERAGESEAEIFDAHLEMLEDPELLEPAEAAIAAGKGAGAAFAAAAREVAAAFRELDDALLAERAVDVEDIAGRVVATVRGEAASGPEFGDEPAIIIARELTPGQTAKLDPARVAGIVAAEGGATSHAAILARALAIPAVLGVGAGVLELAAGTSLIIDGEAGTVTVDPGENALAEAVGQREREAAERARLLERAGEEGRTKDGRRIEVFANVGSAIEAAPAVEQGAEGVGLLRTEFLFLDRAEPPDEEEQVAVLTEIAAAFDGRPIVVRTLDAGADKPLPFVPQDPEANPFLGVRGVRLSLVLRDLFSVQLRAIARVAADHPLKVMFPMVATLAELRSAKALLAEAGAPDGLEVGIMVEVPAVALQAEAFAREADFLSVGTNDLTQYAMAAERGNPQLAGLLDGAPPAVLSLIAATVAGADKHGRWVGVCGELAGDPVGAALLTGLGVTELSMAASRVPKVKAVLRELDHGEAREAARRALGAADAAEVRAIGRALIGDA